MAAFPVMAGFECASSNWYPVLSPPEARLHYGATPSWPRTRPVSPSEASSVSPATLPDMKRRRAFELPGKDQDAMLRPCLCKHCHKFVVPDELSDMPATGVAAWAKSILLFLKQKMSHCKCDFVCPNCHNKLFKATRITQEGPWIKIES